MGEAALEFRVGGAQRRLGLDLEMAGEVHRGEQEVADLVARACPWAAADFGLDLGDLLAQLGEDRPDVVPVEADLAGLLLKLEGARERGQGPWNPAERAVRRLGPRGRPIVAPRRARASPRP